MYIYKTLYRAIEYGQVCRSDDSSMTRQKTKLCHRERAKFSVDSAISIFCSTRKKKKRKRNATSLMHPCTVTKS